MKKILFIILLLIPFMVMAEEKVEITKVEEIKKSDTVTVNHEPTYEGLKINFDLAFTELEDSISYKVTIVNNTKKDYSIENGEEFSKGNYIKYEYKYLTDKKVLKPNETIELQIDITYANQVPPATFLDGRYTETNELTINLSHQDNPVTSNGALIAIVGLSVILFIVTISLYIKSKQLLLLIIPVLFIPITIYAIEKLTIEVTTNIEIVPKTVTVAVGYGGACELADHSQFQEVEYIEGLTKEELFDYYGVVEGTQVYFFPTELVECINQKEYAVYDENPEKYNEYSNNFNACMNTYAMEDIDYNNIKPSSEGVYYTHNSCFIIS